MERDTDTSVVEAIDRHLPALERYVRSMVREALRTARDDDRVAITMAASGFGTRDIADQLGRTELATRALLCRARGRMRQSLAASGGRGALLA